MKAVIIAGGFGTRLRPLSCTRPKHLFPVAGKPLLDWTLERLAKNGVNEVLFAINHLSEAFNKRYGKSVFGMKTRYCREPRPLGTGGCIKNAQKTIGCNDDFLLLNGDILSKLDYAELMAQHTRNGGVATIALHRVKDPSRYGVVELNAQNRISHFIEKPPRGKAPNNLINAGAYALSPKIFDYIHSARRVSIEREVFPALARDKELFGYEFHGLWIDIGEPSDFVRANRLLLEELGSSGYVAKSSRIEATAKINSPVAVGEHTRIGPGSTIGPNVTFSDDVVVGGCVRVRNSVVFPGTTISDFSHIEGAIIGENVLIGKRVKIAENCLIGDHVIVDDGVRLAKNVTVCPHREVNRSVGTSKCLM